MLINLILSIIPPVLERLFPAPQFTPIGQYIEINDNYEEGFNAMILTISVEDVCVALDRNVNDAQTWLKSKKRREQLVKEFNKVIYHLIEAADLHD